MGSHTKYESVSMIDSIVCSLNSDTIYVFFWIPIYETYRVSISNIRSLNQLITLSQIQFAFFLCPSQDTSCSRDLPFFVVVAWTGVQSFDRFFKSVIPHPTVIDLHPLLSRMIVLFYAGDCCHSDAKLPLISCSTVTPTLQSLLSIPLSCIPCTSNSSCDRKWNLNPILLRLLTTHRILW